MGGDQINEDLTPKMMQAAAIRTSDLLFTEIRPLLFTTTASRANQVSLINAQKVAIGIGISSKRK